MPHTIGLFAVCGKTPAGYQVVRKDVSLPAAGFIRDTATCPNGKVVLAGGAQVVGAGTADFKTRMYESAPGTINGGAQSLWLVAMKNNSLIARTVGIFAVCGSKPAGYQVVRKDFTVKPRRVPAQHGVLPRGQGHPRRRRERHRRRHGQLQHPPAGARPGHRRRVDLRAARLAAQLLARSPARSASTPSA